MYARLSMGEAEVITVDASRKVATKLMSPIIISEVMGTRVKTKWGFKTTHESGLLYASTDTY
jgi:hypothetical protein